MSPTSDASTQEAGFSGTLYKALRVFGIVVLALMLVAILYSGWIAFLNWGAIRV